MVRCRVWLCAVVVLAFVPSAVAQPPQPGAPAPRRSPVEGVWYFRGDPRRICFIETVNGPKGPRLLFTNENGAEMSGTSGNGRVSVPGWKLTGTVRGDRLTWANGDYWQR